jgi:hypothetical protein
MLVTADGTFAEQAEPELRITVRVDDKVGLQGAHLTFAKARAAEVFAMRGVKVDWLDGAEANRLKLATPYTILITTEAPAKLKAAMEKVGTEPIPPRDIVTTLGDVMAHELGHLILPPGHSNVGIMRPTLNMMSRRVETFTQQEAAQIREHLQRQSVTETK